MDIWIIFDKFLTIFYFLLTFIVIYIIRKHKSDIFLFWTVIRGMARDYELRKEIEQVQKGVESEDFLFEDKESYDARMKEEKRNPIFNKIKDIRSLVNEALNKKKSKNIDGDLESFDIYGD